MAKVSKPMKAIAGMKTGPVVKGKPAKVTKGFNKLTKY